jgi:hypothetical protein
VMWWVVVAAVALFVIVQLMGKKQFSSIQLPFGEWRSTPRLPLAIRTLSRLLHVGALLFLSASFVHCLIGGGPLEKYTWSSPLAAPPPSPSNSRLLFFVIDHSGSMAEPMPDIPQSSKMNIVKDGMLQCITSIDQRGGQNDFMGLVTFSRAARIEAPLSRDRPFLLEMIKKIVPETIDRLNGTSIGYALFKTVALISACRSFARREELSHEGTPLIGNTIVLITDGLEEPNPADRSHPFRSMRTLQALDYAKESHVKVNYVNVDKHSYQQLSQEERDRLLGAIEATGGRYFEITISQSLSQVMTQISQSMEEQKAPPPQEERMELVFWLIVGALTCVSLSRLLETVGMRVAR